MANIDIDVTLPSGEQITATVPEEWTDAQIEEAVMGADAPAVAEEPENTFGFGVVDQPSVIEKFVKLVDQKTQSSDEVVTDKLVPREKGVPADVPSFEGDPGVTMEPQRFVQPAVTEADVRARQVAERESVMRANYPVLMQDADAARDSSGAKWGSGLRLVTDLITVPLPGSKLKALAELAAGGTKLVGSAAGRTAIAQAAVQAGKGTAVFAGADDAIRQLSDTGKINAEQMGTAALLGGSAGLVLGPVAAGGLGKLLGKMGTKLDNGDKLSADELRDLAPELNTQQVDELLAGFDEVAFAAQYEPKGKISMDTNVSSAKTARDGANSVLVQQREIARAKVHKSRTDLAKRGEGQANSHRMGDDMIELKRNMNAPRTKEGDLKWGFKFGNGAIERLEHIAAGFSPAIRRVTQQTNTRTHRDIARANEFFESKAYTALGRKGQRELHHAMANEDGVKIREITARKEGLTELYNTKVRGLLDEVGRERRALGDREGFQAGFLPRSVISVRKLRKQMGRKEYKGMQESMRKAATEKGKPLDESEIESIVRMHLSGKSTGLKGRRIKEISDKDLDLYDKPIDSIMGYLHRHHENIATKEFFENSLGFSGMKNGEVPESQKLAEAMTKAMMRGDLSDADVDEAAMLINTIFGNGRQAPDAWIQNAKSTMTVGAIGNPISTLTQFQDISQLVDQYGLRATLVSLFGSKMEDVYSSGLKNFAQQTRTPHGLAKVLKSVMDVSGFSALDNVMANTGVNASLRTNMALSKKNPAKAFKKYRDLGFSEDRSRKLVHDLKNRRVSEDVRVLSVVENGKIRPVGIEDLPRALVNSPNGRVFGTLLTWTAKQVNRLRNGAFADMRSGHKIRGTRKLINLVGLMGLTGAGVGSIKQFLRGDDITPMDNFTSSALALGMSGKMAIDKLQRGNGQGAMLTLMPFFGIMEQWGAGILQGATEGDPVQMLSGIGSARNYAAIAQGPAPKIAAAMVGGAYDTLFSGPKAEKEAIIVDSKTRAAVSATGNGADLMPPAESMNNEQSFDVIKTWENSEQKGLNENGRWYPHESVEKGTPTLAFGHKMLNREMESGKVKIGDQMVDWRNGLSDDEANALFEQDMNKAREAVMRTVSVPLSQNELVALTSLIFNVGVGKAGCKPVCWITSKARKALNRGDREEFLVEAFDTVIGFVKVDGEPHDGLIARRQHEKDVWLGR